MCVDRTAPKTLLGTNELQWGGVWFAALIVREGDLIAALEIEGSKYILQEETNIVCNLRQINFAI